MVGGSDSSGFLTQKYGAMLMVACKQVTFEALGKVQAGRTPGDSLNYSGDLDHSEIACAEPSLKNFLNKEDKPE